MAPSSPAEYIRARVVTQHGPIDVAHSLAHAMHSTLEESQSLLRGHQPITEAWADRLADALDMDAVVWLSLQARWDAHLDAVVNGTEQPGTWTTDGGHQHYET